MHAFPKSLINSTKNGTEKNVASQWLSISPNSMISFKFYVYVQTPSFSTFITLHLGAASKPNRRLTGGSVRFRPASIVLNNDSRPEPDGTAGQPAVVF